MGRPTKRKRKRNQPKPPKRTAPKGLPLAGVRQATESLFKHVVAGNDPGRKCGACTTCCTVMRINDLEPPKPGFTDCPHQRKRRDRRGRKPGCTIYPDRPRTCRDWNCYWLDGLFEKQDRPDKIGLLADSSDGALVGLTAIAGFPVMNVRECWPGAHRGKRFKVVMAGLMARTAILYHGEGYPYLMAPTAEMMAKLQAASAKLDHWSLLTDAHRAGDHESGHVPECPICEGQCPVHTEDRGGFFPGCSVCHDAMRAALTRQASAVKEAPDG